MSLKGSPFTNYFLYRCDHVRCNLIPYSNRNGNKYNKKDLVNHQSTFPWPFLAQRFVKTSNWEAEQTLGDQPDSSFYLHAAPFTNRRTVLAGRIQCKHMRYSRARISQFIYGFRKWLMLTIKQKVELFLLFMCYYSFHLYIQRNLVFTNICGFYQQSRARISRFIYVFVEWKKDMREK